MFQGSVIWWGFVINYPGQVFCLNYDWTNSKNMFSDSFHGDKGRVHWEFMGPVCNWNATQHWAIGVAFGDHSETIFFVYKQVYLC